jgi:hypothetical protein
MWIAVLFPFLEKFKTVSGNISPDYLKMKNIQQQVFAGGHPPNY